MSQQKEKELRIQLTSVNERMGYEAVCGVNPPLPIDYIPPAGDGQGYTSLELFLASLASCAAATMAAMLRGRGHRVEKVEGEAIGLRRRNHPMGFEKIEVTLAFFMDPVAPGEMERIAELAEKSVCPVWNMIDKKVAVELGWRIENPIKTWTKRTRDE